MGVANTECNCTYDETNVLIFNDGDYIIEYYIGSCTYAGFGTFPSLKIKKITPIGTTLNSKITVNLSDNSLYKAILKDFAKSDPLGLLIGSPYGQVTWGIESGGCWKSSIVEGNKTFERCDIEGCCVSFYSTYVVDCNEVFTKQLHSITDDFDCSLVGTPEEPCVKYCGDLW